MVLMMVERKHHLVRCNSGRLSLSIQRLIAQVLLSTPPTEAFIHRLLYKKRTVKRTL